MVAIFTLCVSVLLQLGAAVLALRLIHVTGRRLAWILIASGIALMALRRSVTLFHAMSGDLSHPPDLAAELIALVISVVMFAGVVLIFPVFRWTRHSEEVLRQSEKRYRTLMECANDAIFIADAETGIILDANKRAEELLGMARDGIIGMHQTQLHPQDQSEAYRGIFRDHASREGGHELEARVRHSGGRTIPVEIRASVIDLGDRKVIQGIFRDITERKRIEEALRESRRTLSTLMSNLPGMAYRRLNDEDWTMEFVSEGCMALTGHPPTDLLRSQKISYAQVIHPDDREPVWHNVQSAIENKQPFRLVYRICTARGEEKWVWEQGRGVYASDSTLQALEGFITDITETKHAEEALQEAHDRLEQRVEDRTADLTAANERLRDEIAVRERVEQTLRESEKKYRTLIDCLPQRVFYKNRESVYVSCNHSYATDLNTDPEDMVGKTDYEFHPKEFAEKYRADDRRIIESGKTEEIEEEYVQDGRRLIVQTVKTPVRDEKGNVVGILGIFWDITDRKRAQEALVTRLLYEEALAECSRALLVEADAEEALTDTLHDLQKASNVSRVYMFENFTDPVDGLCMRQTHEACAPGVAPELANPLLQHLPYKCGFSRWQDKLSKGELVGGVVRDFPQAEQEVLEPQDIRSILVLPIWSEGQWYGFIGFDDTQAPRVWTQEDVRLLQTAAEMIGAFIAGRCAEARLRKAKDAAEAASRAKSAFLANMSHEIRTPITATLAAAELLASHHSEGARVEEHVDVILRNGRHLLALIDDLLELSRAEARGVEVRPVSCSLLDIMADVQAVTRPLHRRPSVDFRILYDTPVPQRIRTDPTRLKQAAINLISNALKFTETGHVWVHVGVHRNQPEPRLSIAVEDTGVGIPAADTERIFETFAQLKPGPSGVFGGVGLGLPVSKGIAEQLGGSIEVSSVENRGSTFTLRVPTGPLEGAEWITPEAVLLPPTELLPKLVSQRSVGILYGTVLLAEDFADTRRLIEEALTGCGVTVTSVENGEDAVRAALSTSFDVILMDIRMPGMDGLSATAELRRRGCLTPIIALTASTDPGNRARVLAAGFDDMWTKPMTLENLVEEVSAYLQAAPLEARRPDQTSDDRAAQTTVNERLAAARAEFVRNLPGRLNRITTAVRNGDLQEAADALHQLVGSGGIHGFMSLSHEAARLLELANGGALAECRHELPALEELVEHIVNS